MAVVLTEAVKCITGHGSACRRSPSHLASSRLGHNRISLVAKWQRQCFGKILHMRTT